MKCPYCQQDNDRVIDSRSAEAGAVIRRRRECLACGRRYTTYERVEKPTLYVIKKHNEREPFDREKILRGVQKACWKRPISAEQINDLVAAVEAAIYAEYDTEVPSQAIGEEIMQQLKRLDHVAYVRFASVYRQFQDVRDFLDEVATLERPGQD